MDTLNPSLQATHLTPDAPHPTPRTRHPEHYPPHSTPCALRPGKVVDAALNDVLTDMLGRIVAAIDLLDDLPNAPGCGWLEDEPACDFGCQAGVLCTPSKVWKANATR